MRLTVYTDYSLRLLMYVALKPEGLTTIGEVADAYDISRNHLMKITHQLGLGGYLETVRGKGGGFRLARPADSITVGDIVRWSEPDMALVPCLPPLNAGCAVLPACVLKGALHTAGEAFLQVLDGYTLADLIAPKAMLRDLLSLAPA